MEGAAGRSSPRGTRSRRFPSYQGGTTSPGERLSAWWDGRPGWNAALEDWMSVALISRDLTSINGLHGQAVFSILDKL